MLLNARIDRSHPQYFISTEIVRNYVIEDSYGPPAETQKVMPNGGNNKNETPK